VQLSEQETTTNVLTPNYFFFRHKRQT